MLAVDFKRWSAFTMTWGWALTWTLNRAWAWVLPFVLSSGLLVPVARADEARAQDSGKQKEVGVALPPFEDVGGDALRPNDFASHVCDGQKLIIAKRQSVRRFIEKNLDFA